MSEAGSKAGGEPAGAMLARLSGLSPEKRAKVLRATPPAALRAWAAHFADWAHRGQRPPEGDWRTWVIMGGRGFGKTRAGAEWVLGEMRASGEGDTAGGRHGSKSHVVGRGHSRAGRAGAAKSPLRIALVGATIDEARAVMVEGPSGLLTLARSGEVERWSASERRLVFRDGAEAHLYSGAFPAKLRGPEHDIAWCDELGKWRRAGESWDMLQLGLRRGGLPRAVVTTTPSSEPALTRVLAAAGTVTTGGATHANRHLPRAFVEAVEAAYGGTRLGAQEIEGVLAVDREGSLWPAGLIERCRWSGGDAWRRVVVGVDPPASAAGTCGIVVAATTADGRAAVLADLSVGGRSPEGWARAVAAVAWDADRVVAEANQGGAMVASVLRAAAVTLPLKLVHASRGKAARAEPVAALFECGRAGFDGRFAALEAELAQFTAGGWKGEGSPDRADAMVWALWALCLEGQGVPAIRMT